MFLVGSRRKEFYIHRELLVKVSDVLRALISGGMSESIKGEVEWPDVDEETFVRFSEFVYNGAYTDAEHKCDQDAPPNSSTQSPTSGGHRLPTFSLQYFRTRHMYLGDVDTVDGLATFVKRCSSTDPLHSGWLSCITRLRAVNRFRSSCYNAECQINDPLTSRNTKGSRSTVNWAPAWHNESDAPIKPVLDCHYKVHILADKYIIPELQAMAHDRLHRALYGLHLRDRESLRTDSIRGTNRSGAVDRCLSQDVALILCMLCRLVAGNSRVHELLGQKPGICYEASAMDLRGDAMRVKSSLMHMAGTAMVERSGRTGALR